MPVGTITPGTPVVVTPDAAPLAPLWSMNAPTATMAVVAAHIQALTLAFLNSKVEGVASTGALSLLTGIPNNARVFADGQHVAYVRYAAGLPVGSDGFWVLDSADGGKFIHPGYSALTGQHLAYIGPIPNETTTHPTQAGRINKQFIPFGVVACYFNNFNPQYSTSSATATTLGTPYDTDGFAADERPVPEFALIELQVSAWVNGNSGALFNATVWLEYSFDAGATWTAVPRAPTAPLVFALTADNLPKALPLSFFVVYPSYSGAVAGRFMVRLRATSDGTHQVVVQVESDMIRIIRR